MIIKTQRSAEQDPLVTGPLTCPHCGSPVTVDESVAPDRRPRRPARGEESAADDGGAEVGVPVARWTCPSCEAHGVVHRPRDRD